MPDDDDKKADLLVQAKVMRKLNELFVELGLPDPPPMLFAFQDTAGTLRSYLTNPAFAHEHYHNLVAELQAVHDLHFARRRPRTVH